MTHVCAEVERNIKNVVENDYVVEKNRLYGNSLLQRGDSCESFVTINR